MRCGVAWASRRRGGRGEDMIVADDRLEEGTRERLNLGHTFAHAHRARIALPDHARRGGRARAYAPPDCSRCAPDASASASICACSRCWRCCGCRCSTSLDAERLLAAMRSDKKRRDGTLRFVLPRAIGDVEYGVEVPTHVRSVLDVLRARAERRRG